MRLISSLCRASLQLQRRQTSNLRSRLIHACARWSATGSWNRSLRFQRRFNNDRVSATTKRLAHEAFLFFG